VHVYIHTYTYRYVCVCVCVCVYIYIYMHIYTYASVGRQVCIICAWCCMVREAIHVSWCLREVRCCVRACEAEVGRGVVAGSREAPLY
jgi:hypothetical protein